jgi:predicted RNase H-related nuclease YkuK (DUF458 family)
LRTLRAILFNDKILTMNEQAEIKFNSPTLGRLNFTEVVYSLVDYMEEFPKEKYRVVVGTDSRTSNLEQNHKVELITAIAIHRLGRGGRYFWRRETKINIHTLRQKIYEETNLSLATAQKLLNSLNNYLENVKSEKNIALPKYELEIHVDIGQAGPTREMIKEIVGMVNGFGFFARTKPEAYAASKVADKHT